MRETMMGYETGFNLQANIIEYFFTQIRNIDTDLQTKTFIVADLRTFQVI